MKRVKSFIGYIIIGIICAIACIFLFKYEAEQQVRYYRLTIGAAALAILFFWASFASFSKKYDRNAIMVIEAIFPMQTGGCVVAGVVQGGFMTHDKIEVITSTYGTIKSRIHSMEIKGRKVNIAKDCKVAIYLKDIEPSKLHIQDKVVYKE